ncbi:oligosaccharide flippase family protein [Frigidibacter sp. MR17.24]|uniref:oligosaccharide flippase family protein n=1 Tax=Frigidibacter sp. MR17.24 TaxID=3127345 RepID=UPI0030130918
MLRSAVLLLSSNLVASVLLLARNLLLARLVPVADYGIASTFAVVIAVIEMMTQLGLQQQIVQSKDGDDPRLQAVLQGFQLIRGLIAGAVLVAIAGPAAQFMGVPGATASYRLLGLVPVLNALVHFDIYRLQRRMVFLPQVLSTSLPAALSLAALWPLATVAADYRILLWAILLQYAAMVVISHLLAERRWRLGFDRRIIAESSRFGAPLLINGILLFAVFNGERVIVGRELGMEVLAILSMGLTLTLTPTQVLARSVQSLFLPRLSSARPAAGAEPATAGGRSWGAAFDRLALASFQLHLLLALAVIVAVAVLGPPAVLWLFGEKYAALPPILIWLAIQQGLRLYRGGPTTVALARGQTGNAMWANLPRVALIGLAWWWLVQGAGLLEVVLLGVLGEAVGCLVAFALVRQRLGVPLLPLLPSTLAAVLVMALAGGVASPELRPAALSPLWFEAGVVLAFLAALACFRPLWRVGLRRRRAEGRQA